MGYGFKIILDNLDAVGLRTGQPAPHLYSTARPTEAGSMLRTTIAPGPAPTVYLAGEMDLDCADTLREAVAEAARGAQMVVLDFAGVEFIDSSGTGIFVRLCLDMKSQGTPLVARNLSPAVRGVFDMLRVRELVGDEVFPD